MRIILLLASACVLTGCATPELFRQNLSSAHKVKRGMTLEQAREIMETPAHAMWLNGVLEWRYCDSREHTDQYVVLYFHDDRVIDKTSYTLLNPSPNMSDDRIGDCRDNVSQLYSDGRSPPRRVRELRAGKG
jgi:hypothetical protein